LDAATPLPALTVRLSEGVPATEKLAVQAGYIVNSYSALDAEAGKGDAADTDDNSADGTAADTNTNENDNAAGEAFEPKDAVRFAAAVADAATLELANVEAQSLLDAAITPQSTPALEGERGFAAYLIKVSAAKGALIDETHTLRVSDMPDTAAGAGMLDAEGIVAFDATGLTDEQLASINPADGATLAAAGVTAA